MSKLLVLNGPNLNLLGLRETDIYGDITLEQINFNLKCRAQKFGYNLFTFQSNSENKLIERIHIAYDEGINFIIINPAAFTHTSIALRDALLAVQIPFIEIHLSNINNRECFRKKSYFSDIAVGVICGFGHYGYYLALQFILENM